MSDLSQPGAHELLVAELLDAMADNYSKWQAAENIRDLPEAPGRD